MSTSVGDLLAAAAHEIKSLNTPDARMSATCIATLKPAARAFTELAATSADKDTREMLQTIAARFGELAHAWPPIEARPGDLINAAADLVVINPPKKSDATWALAVAFGDLALTTLDHVSQVALVGDHELILQARSSLLALHRAAATNPPTTRGNLILDDLVPHPAIIEGGSHLERATESLVALVGLTRRAAISASLSVAETLACSAACEAAASEISNLLNDINGKPSASTEASAVAWRAIQVACGPFDDGTKRNATDNAGVLLTARRVVTELQRHHSSHPPGHDPDERPRDAVDVRTHLMANQLPRIAESIEVSLEQWGNRRLIVAPERSLASFELRNTAAPKTSNRIVAVARSDLDELKLAVRDAKILSTSLVKDTIASLPSGKPNPQPHLAASYAETTLEDRRGLTRRANRADRVAHRTLQPWSLPRAAERGRRHGR